MLGRYLRLLADAIEIRRPLAEKDASSFLSHRRETDLLRLRRANERQKDFFILVQRDALLHKTRAQDVEDEICAADCTETRILLVHLQQKALVVQAPLPNVSTDPIAQVCP